MIFLEIGIIFLSMGMENWYISPYSHLDWLQLRVAVPSEYYPLGPLVLTKAHGQVGRHVDQVHCGEVHQVLQDLLVRHRLSSHAGPQFRVSQSKYVNLYEAGHFFGTS